MYKSYIAKVIKIFYNKSDKDFLKQKLLAKIIKKTKTNFITEKYNKREILERC